MGDLAQPEPCVAIAPRCIYSATSVELKSCFFCESIVARSRYREPDLSRVCEIAGKEATRHRSETDPAPVLVVR